MNSPSARISFLVSPNVSKRALSPSVSYKNSHAERAVSVTDAISITTFPLSGLYARNSFSSGRVSRRARGHKPSQSSWAGREARRSKNPFLRITRGRAVGSAAAENHEKRGELIAATGTSITLYYTVEPSSLFLYAILFVVSCRLGILSRFSLSMNVQVDEGLRAACR